MTPLLVEIGRLKEENKKLALGHKLIWNALYGDQQDQADLAGLTPLDEIMRLKSIPQKLQLLAESLKREDNPELRDVGTEITEIIGITS